MEKNVIVRLLGMWHIARYDDGGMNYESQLGMD